MEVLVLLKKKTTTHYASHILYLTMRRHGCVCDSSWDVKEKMMMIVAMGDDDVDDERDENEK